MGCNESNVNNSSFAQTEYTHFFSRQLITADDLTQDQIYYREKRRMHNRLLHGWGIVCGLEVKPNPLSGAPLNVTICPGYALSPQGDEIFVPKEFQFDLALCIQSPGISCPSPCSKVVSTAVNPKEGFYIVIKFAECPSRPVRVPPLGCGCDETACEYSRIREGFEVTCVQSLPESYGDATLPADLCSQQVLKEKVAACPPCPNDPRIVLGKVTIANQDSSPIVDNTDRRILVSTVMMQNRLLQQCG